MDSVNDFGKSLNQTLLSSTGFVSLGIGTSVGERKLLIETSQSKIILATIVEGDLKAAFSIATMPWCRSGCNSTPWISPFYPWSVPYNTEC